MNGFKFGYMSRLNMMPNKEYFLVSNQFYHNEFYIIITILMMLNSRIHFTHMNID